MKKYIYLATIIIITGVSFLVHPFHAHAAQQIAVPINGTGGVEQALLTLPNDYNSTSTQYPLLIFLHGRGESLQNGGSINAVNNIGPGTYINNGSWPTSFTNPADGQSYKYIVLLPQYAGDWSTSGAQLNYIINYMVANYRVNTNRIYGTGLSAGGQGVFDYTVHNGVTPTYPFAAYVPMSAVIDPSQALQDTTIADNVHTWAFGSSGQDIWGQRTFTYVHGTDPNYQVTGWSCSGGTPCTGLGSLGRFTDYSGGHCCWNTYYNPTYTETISGVSMNIYQWMLQYSRGSTPPPPSNIPPNANAGADQTITSPTSSVSLSGSGTDQDGTIASYSWQVVSGSGASITSPSSASTSVTGLSPGTYTLRLTVTDNLGATGYDDMIVTVNPAQGGGGSGSGPYGGTARAIPGTIQVEDYDLGGQNVGSYDSDPTNDGNAYRLSEAVDIENTSDTGGGYNIGWTVAGEWMKYSVNVSSSGTYSLQARVASIYSGKSISIEMDGSAIATINIPQTGGWQTWQSVTVNNISLTSGAHVMRIYENTDGFNLNWVSFTSTGGTPTNNPPIVNAGVDQTITLPTSSVTVNGTATDPEGQSMTYAWTKVSGGTATITSPTSLSTTITGLTSGTYTFWLTATDSLGASSADAILITVNASTPPPSGPTSTQTIGQGEYQIFFIDGSGKLWAQGNQGNSGVGGGGDQAVAQPVVVSPSNLTFRYVAGALHNGAAIDTSGNVWTMGENNQGQAGIGSTTYSANAQKILTDINGNAFTNVDSVTAFSSSQGNGWFAIKSDGTLWVWGTPGSLRGDGTDSTSMVLRPTQITIPGGRLAKKVSAQDFAVLLATDGTVWTWGTTNVENLGYAMTGSQYTTPHQLTGLSGISQVAGGRNWNYALTSGGTLYGWGVLGDYMGDTTYPNGGWVPYATPRVLTNITNSLPSTISKIAITYMTSVVLLADGSVWTWGDNTQGMIGNGQEYLGTPTTGYGWDWTSHLFVKSPYHVAPGKQFSDIAGGGVYSMYTYITDTNGQMYAWGRNKSSVIADRVKGAGFGGIESSYANSWDVVWPKPVNPFSVSSAIAVTSPYCITNPSVAPCNEYTIPANTAPVANAGTTQNITGSTATLNGSASTDNVYIMYYEWSQVSGPNNAVIDLPGSSSPQVSNLVNGTYVFKLKVTDSGWMTNTSNVTVNVGTVTPPPSGGTIRTIGTGSGQIILSSIPNLTCGDTVAITAGTYAGITLTGLQGCANNPIIIRNSGGQVIMNQWGLELHDVHHAIVKSETPGTYGFKIIAPFRAGVTISDSSNDIDVSGTYTTGAGYGVVAKTDPACTTIGHFYPNVIEDINIHDNLIEGTTYEGMYLGYYDPATVTITCNGTTMSVKAERLSRVFVHDNILNNTGNDGIKLRLCTNGCDIYNNTINGYGVLRTTDTAWCFGIQVGSETYGKVYNNRVEYGYCSAINIHTNDTTTKYQVYNNITSHAGTLPGGASGAVWAGGVLFDILAANQKFSIINNTSSNQKGADLETTNYSNFAYDGNVCNNGPIEKWTNGTIKPTCISNNLPPSANAGASQTITLPISQVTLTGSGTDTDGTIASYAWTKISGSGNISTATSASTVVTGLTAGTSTFRLTVTDNGGATATDDVLVFVNTSQGGSGGGSGGGGGGGGSSSGGSGSSGGGIGNTGGTGGNVTPTKNINIGSIIIPVTGVTRSSSLQNIKYLQAFLNLYLGNKITPLIVDGKWGAKTITAIKLFQKSVGLKADGSFGKVSASKAIDILKTMK